MSLGNKLMRFVIFLWTVWLLACTPTDYVENTVPETAVPMPTENAGVGRIRPEDSVEPTLKPTTEPTLKPTVEPEETAEPETLIGTPEGIVEHRYDTKEWDQVWNEMKLYALDSNEAIEALLQLSKERLSSYFGSATVETLWSRQEGAVREAVRWYVHNKWSNDDRPLTREEAYTLWQSWGIDDYEFITDHHCMCLFGIEMIAVRDGQVADMMFIHDTKMTDEYDTYDDHFEHIAQLEFEVDALYVTYDPLFGVPTSYFVNHVEAISDAQTTYRFSDFVPRVESESIPFGPSIVGSAAYSLGIPMMVHDSPVPDFDVESMRRQAGELMECPVEDWGWDWGWHPVNCSHPSVAQLGCGSHTIHARWQAFMPENQIIIMCKFTKYDEPSYDKDKPFMSGFFSGSYLLIHLDLDTESVDIIRNRQQLRELYQTHHSPSMAVAYIYFDSMIMSDSIYVFESEPQNMLDADNLDAYHFYENSFESSYIVEVEDGYRGLFYDYAGDCWPKDVDAAGYVDALTIFISYDGLYKVLERTHLYVYESGRCS